MVTENSCLRSCDRNNEVPPEVPTLMKWTPGCFRQLLARAPGHARFSILEIAGKSNRDSRRYRTFQLGCEAVLRQYAR